MTTKCNIKIIIVRKQITLRDLNSKRMQDIPAKISSK